MNWIIQPSHVGSIHPLAIILASSSDSSDLDGGESTAPPTKRQRIGYSALSRQSASHSASAATSSSHSHLLQAAPSSSLSSTSFSTSNSFASTYLNHESDSHSQSQLMNSLNGNLIVQAQTPISPTSTR